MRMRQSLFAVLVMGLCASSNAAFASDSYKPDFGDTPLQQDAKVWRTPPHRVKHKSVSVPLFNDCRYAERSFEGAGEDNSSFDPVIGCSTRANLAAMIENRKDLVKGRGTRYSDGERAGNVVSYYRAWKSNAPASAGATPEQ